MAIKISARLKKFGRFKASSIPREDTTERPPVILPSGFSWVTQPGNIGKYLSGATVSLTISAYDPSDSISEYIVEESTLPAGFQFNKYTGELYGILPESLDTHVYTLRLLCVTDDFRILQGTFTITQEYVPLEVNWITPAGDIGEYSLGAPVVQTLEAKANKL